MYFLDGCLAGMRATRDQEFPFLDLGSGDYLNIWKDILNILFCFPF